MSAARIGFVGAGRMGAPMVRRLVAAGHDVQALGRTVDKRTALAQLGAQPVCRIAEVGADADVVVVCVFTDAQVRDVCLDGPLVAAMPRGSTLVLHTTGSPRTAEDVAAHAAESGVAVVDAPVSGGPHNVAAGELTVFVGGDAAVVARIEPVLSGYAAPILHVGPIGTGQRVKLVNNALFAAQIGLLREGVALGARLGVDEETLLKALPHASANSRALAGVAARGSVAAFTAAVGDFVGKDVDVVRGVAAELGGNLGLLDDVIGTRFDAASPAASP